MKRRGFLSAVIGLLAGFGGAKAVTKRDDLFTDYYVCEFTAHDVKKYWDNAKGPGVVITFADGYVDGKPVVIHCRKVTFNGTVLGVARKEPL